MNPFTNSAAPPKPLLSSPPTNLMSCHISDDEDYRTTIAKPAEQAPTAHPQSAKHRLGQRLPDTAFVGNWWINPAVVRSSVLRHEFAKVAIYFESKIEDKAQELARVVSESNRVLEKQKEAMHTLKLENEKLGRKLKKKNRACKKLRELAFDDESD